MTLNNDMAVSVRSLTRKFGDFTAVNGIDFDVAKGEIFGFLGPNGAGKSTTIRMLCGILAPTSGIGEVAGHDITSDQEAIKENIGYMSQKFSLYDDLTVEENIDFYGSIYKIPAAKKKERKEWILKMAGIEGLRSRLTKELSGGWKQRLALGCAIIHEPRIIFLDEPTSGVDPITRMNFWSLIKDMAKSGVTVFVTTHYMDEAENCNRMALIYRGSVIAMGTPTDLKTKFMRDEVVRICLSRPEDWTESALFGSCVHAVVASSQKAIPAIKKLLFDAKEPHCEVGVISPTLEDVFVSLVEDYDRMHANGSGGGHEPIKS
jgi:ABC-2 type transport system ATP-binding protein